MSKTIGKCGFCSYGRGIPKPSGEAAAVQSTAAAATDLRLDESKPVVVRFTASRPLVTEVIAEAYREAALADADMVATARKFEQVRAWFLTEQDGLKIWSLLEAEIGAAETSSVQPSLISLRAWFKEQLFSQQQQRLSELFESDPHNGWREWLRTYAEGVAEWRVTALCQPLVDLPLPFPDRFHEPYDFERNTLLIKHERWTQVYRFFRFLAEHDFLHPLTRARLIITSGQVQLYFFRPLENALPLFQEAEKLAPSHGRVLAALGDYYLHLEDFSRARAYLEQAIKATPDEAEGYIYLGDLADKQGDQETARVWYQEAINKVGSETTALTRLILLYGRKELIEKYEPHIVPLAERAVAVDEESGYSVYLDVGDAYASGQRFTEAHQWYQRAIDFEPDRLDGYARKGFTCMEEGEGRYVDARQAFSKAIEVAPDAYNGYWGMGQLCEREEKREEAIRWYEQVADRQPEFLSSMKARIGEILWKLKKYQEAEAKLFEALELEHTNDSDLMNLADDYYQNLGKTEEALRLYQRIREIKGPDFEASYQNRIGNVYYYNGDYERASQHYLKAIEADREKTPAIYFSNLGGTYKRLGRWAEAREQFKRAYELDGNQTAYDAEVAHVFNEEAIEYYSRGDLERAIAGYSEAINLDLGLPRIFSNRALAYERLAPDSLDPMKTLESALADAGKALELARSKEDQAQINEYSEQLARLERERSFVNRYGHRALAFEHREKPIRVRLSHDALAIFLDAEMTDLSEESINQIKEMRQRIKDRYGLSVPGVNFDLLEEGSDYLSNNYQIEVMGEADAYGELRIDQQFAVCSQQLVRHIEVVVTRNLDRFCDHQAAVDFLEQCSTDDCAEINRDLHHLNVLTQALKDRLKRGEPIADFAGICEKVNQTASTGAGISTPSSHEGPAQDFFPGVASLTLYVNQSSLLNREDLDEGLMGMQEALFQRSGVIVPLVKILESGDLAQHDFQLQLDDRKLSVCQGLNPGEFWVLVPFEDVKESFPDARPTMMPGSESPTAILKAPAEVRQEYEAQGHVTFDPSRYVALWVASELQRRFDELLTADLVDFYLSKLKVLYPVLVDVTRYYFSTEELTLRLRERLRAPSSIRNLPEVLDALLVF